MKQKIKRLEQVAGIKDRLPIVVELTDEGLYKYQGKLYTEEELNKLNKKLFVYSWQ